MIIRSQGGIDYIIKFLPIDDRLVERLKHIEEGKELIENEWEMDALEKLIYCLNSLSRNAKMWFERLTPTNRKCRVSVYDKYKSAEDKMYR
jgi:hypothetical protein